MGNFSNYLEGKLLDHAFKTAGYTQPTHIYVALSTTQPANDGTNVTEPSGAAAYARKQCDAWDAASGNPRMVKNTGAVNFATPTGSWGTVTHFALFDDPTAGNMLGWGACAVAKAIGAGDTPSFAAGDLVVTLT